MNYSDLFTRRDAELALLNKGQKSQRYKIGERWELNFKEIREAFDEFEPKTEQCEDPEPFYNKKGAIPLNELWAVEFSLMMQDVVVNDTPSIDGEILVRGNSIFNVLEKAKNKLRTFGYDRLIIHGASRSNFEKTKGETENE